MIYKKISDIDASTTVNGADVIEIEQSGVSKSMTLTTLIDNGILPSVGSELTNKIINGDFDFWQRGTSKAFAVGGTANGYVADKWATYLVGTGAACTNSRQSFTLGQTDVPGNPYYFHRCQVTNGGPATTAEVPLYQCVEDVRTLSGGSATLSFWAKADAPKNISIEFSQLFGTGGSPSARVNTFGAKIALTTTWAKYSVTVNIPSITGKTIGTDGANTSFLNATIWLSAGSNFNSRTDTLGIQTGTFDFARFRLVAGVNATEIEARPYGLELALCQRYYEKSYGLNVVPGTVTSSGRHIHSGTSDASNIMYTTVFFKAQKRIGNATPVLYNAGSGATGTWEYARNGASGSGTASITAFGEHSMEIQTNIGAAWAAGLAQGHWIVDVDF